MNEQGDCYKCFDACQSCFGPGPEECLSCKAGYYSLNHSCLQHCPSGFYNDTSAMHCAACYKMCETCHGPSEYACKQCVQSAFQFDPVSRFETFRCLAYCPSRYYNDESTRKCTRCHTHCLQCTAADMCQLCVKSTYMLQTLPLG